MWPSSDPVANSCESGEKHSDLIGIAWPAINMYKIHLFTLILTHSHKGTSSFEETDTKWKQTHAGALRCNIFTLILFFFFNISKVCYFYLLMYVAVCQSEYQIYSQYHPWLHLLYIFHLDSTRKNKITIGININNNTRNIHLNGYNFKWQRHQHVFYWILYQNLWVNFILQSVHAPVQKKCTGRQTKQLQDCIDLKSYRHVEQTQFYSATMSMFCFTAQKKILHQVPHRK